ncbi:peptidoglycan-binding protein [Streptomyces olivoreticuli]|uniref:peptidoglycan-binding protein n=1 Tax=Streptomyces olivoreticuli TaxID=68246 RepID=UPI0023DE0101|nr:peptidoglycan-binding protein [Streptomyces olivoreticuli]
MNWQPWCDMFVSYCAEETGNAAAVGKFAYCPSHVEFFKNRGQWYGPRSAVKAGDVVFFHTGDGIAYHVGIVLADAEPGASVRTVEGNTSSGNAGSQNNGDGVYYRTRPRSMILGFGRPAFTSTAGGTTGTPSGGSRWTVKRGQTLGAIAALCGTTVAALLALNPGVKDADQINEGQELNIPATAKPTPGETSKPTEPDKAKPDAARVSIDGQEYGPGAYGPHITALGKALVDKGFGRHYKEGPGPRWSEADRLAYAEYQRSLGYTGTDADGIPGPASLHKLLTPAPAKPKPAPVNPAPAKPDQPQPAKPATPPEKDRPSPTDPMGEGLWTMEKNADGSITFRPVRPASKKEAARAELVRAVPEAVTAA